MATLLSMFEFDNNEFIKQDSDAIKPDPNALDRPVGRNLYLNLTFASRSLKKSR